MRDQDRCPECGHKSEPEKLRDPGQAQDRLPDEVLDRAMEVVESQRGAVLPGQRAGVRIAAPVLVEHGRQQRQGEIDALETEIRSLHAKLGKRGPRRFSR